MAKTLLQRAHNEHKMKSSLDSFRRNWMSTICVMGYMNIGLWIGGWRRCRWWCVGLGGRGKREFPRFIVKGRGWSPRTETEFTIGQSPRSYANTELVIIHFSFTIQSKAPGLLLPPPPPPPPHPSAFMNCPPFPTVCHLGALWKVSWSAF